MPTVTIYALKDPRDGQIRYVGQTKRTPEKRLYFHLKDQRKTRNRSWLASLSSAGLSAEIEVLELVEDGRWADRERFWIAHYRSVGCNLNNHTDGGEGSPGMDEDVRKKLSIAQKRVMSDPEFKAKLFTKEYGEKISQVLKGVPRPWVSKLPQNQPGHRMPESQKEKLRVRMTGNTYRRGLVTGKPAWNTGKVTGKPAWNRGIKFPHEVGEKISKKLTGRCKSESHKENIRRARIAYWDNIRKQRENGKLSIESSNG